jgi:eukaryotic-like serine/threonine-protein kinase
MYWRHYQPIERRYKLLHATTTQTGNPGRGRESQTMSGKITLTITTGPKTGTTFVFEDHDTLLLGRKKDCQVSIPEDTFISRHHFILEVNPPDIRLRDLGSLHGTFINGQKYGGRERHETPIDGVRREFAQVDLHDGDEIKAGQTTFRVRVETAARSLIQVSCLHCDDSISIEPDDDHICASCQMRSQEDHGSHQSSLPQQSLSFTQKGIIFDYQIIQKLGEGGMGAVYLVEPIKGGQRTALKIMPPKVPVNEQSRQRFLREIEATRELRHPNIVTFLNSGTQPGFLYFLLEFCEGGDVARLMQRRGGRLTLEEAGPILLQALQGLAFAHKRNFVHRDVKPQNILLCGKEGRWQAKLSDLGLAKNFEQAGFNGLTLTGDKAGSEQFMPHEQVTNFKHIKSVSDVWAMGATSYHILTGSYPRNHLATQDQVKVILQEEVIPIRTCDPHIPKPVADVIDRSLAYKESERYQHAGEMYEALKKALSTR